MKSMTTGKCRKALSTILSLLIAVQTPAMAGVFVVDEDIAVSETQTVEEDTAQEVIATEETSGDIVMEEELPGEAEEVVIPEETIEEVIPEEVTEEAIAEEITLGGELLEEATEDTFEEELILAPIENTMEEELTEQINMVLPEEGSVVEEDEQSNEPALVGENLGRCGLDCYWSLSDDGELIISGTGSMYDYGGYSIPPWYSQRNQIKAIIIEEGVTSIGKSAFQDCIFVENVTISDSIKSINNQAFYYCDSLTNITIGSGVTSIGEAVFYECSSLTNITIPDSVTNISHYAFYHCSSLTSVEIPDSVTYIGVNAFEGCSSLTSVEFPNSMTMISKYMFSGCTSLANVTIPSSITAIGGMAFYGCSSLTSVTIPDSVTDIWQSAFGECTSLTSVTLGKGVIDLKEGVFEGCSALTSIKIPGSVANIGSDVFKNCSSLISVIIENGVLSIGERAFYECSSLRDIAIPDSVRSIGESAFYECNSLMDITIPNGVRSIGKRAFCSCDALISVTIGNGVTVIEDSTFSFCSTLKSVSLPKNITSIGRDAFAFCGSLTSVTIPGNVSSIGEYAFELCYSLKTIIFEGNAPQFVVDQNLYSQSRAFSCVTANAYYPIDNKTWTTHVMQGYGGEITWKPWPYVSASDIVLNSSFLEDQTTYIEVSENIGGGTLSYYSDNSNVIVDDSGRVTITRGFVGSATITIKSVVSDSYKEAETKIKVTTVQRKLFSDVTDPTQFYFDPIYWAVDNGITTGYSDNTFRPNNLCHRAAVVTFLWRLAGEPDEGISTAFSDMTGNDDFDRAITWASNHGITTGYDDGTFRPYNPCHRAAIVTFIWRYAGKPEPSSAAGFSDMTKNVEFDKAIAWAAENNITTGYNDGTFRPYNSCLRLAVVTFLYRYAHL